MIGLRDFMLGTLIGMGPGILLTVAFAHQLVASLRHPTAGSFGVLIGIGVALVAVSMLLQRFLGRKERVEEGERQRKREAQAPHERVVDVEVEAPKGATKDATKEAAREVNT
jgi:hypothetical protein